MTCLSRRLAAFYPLLFSVLLNAQAISAGATFSTPAEEERYQQLIRTIRCPTCQNQNIAESDAPLAGQLRDLIGGQIAQGKNDAQILSYLIARYGDFISYDPRLQKSTLFLWLGPPLVMLLAALGWFRGRRRNAKGRLREAASDPMIDDRRTRS